MKASIGLAFTVAIAMGIVMAPTPALSPTGPCPRLCGRAVPEPVVPSSGGPRTILLMGDSLWTAGRALAARLPGDTVTNLGWGGSSLLDPQFAPGGPVPPTGPRISGLLASGLARYRPQLVVFEWSGNYWGTQYVAGSQPFYAAWLAEAQALDAEARAAGARTLWVLPPSRAPGYERMAASFAAVYLLVGARVVSWNVALTDGGSGRYDDWLTYGPGDFRHVRTSDRVHFTHEGERRVAVWTAATIRSM